MPDVDGFLWGLSDGFWHKLTRHDPEYRTEQVESVRLTALARAKDPEAPAVMAMLPGTVDGPGTGRTRCGIEGLALEAIGVDAEEGDALCPACKALGPTT